MAADKQIAVTDDIYDRLDARRAEGEAFYTVVARLLDHSEATQAERSDADDIAAEVATALANGDVPVTLADGEADRIAQKAREARENGGETV